jgi:Tol biopolymer transport system component
MTTSDRLERTLPGILDDLSAGPAPDFLDDVFAKTARMPQRPGWTFPERWLPMADIARTRAYAPAPPWRLIAVALILIALVVAALIVAGSQRRVAPPFGPARNGEIVYDLTGDLYVGDPVTGESRLLVGDPGIDTAPSYSPDGTQIAFLREADCCGLVDIYVMDEDGSNLHRVTSSPIPKDDQANWTPDSRHLWVISGPAGPGRLRLLDADGTEPPLQLAPDMTVDRVAFRPPDGRELAVRAIVDGKYGVYAIKADGSGVPIPILEADVPLDMDMHAGDMIYSPDGERLFYQSYGPAADGFSGGCCQLSVVNADGTNPHRFEGANPAAWTGVPSVSPDGRWVSFWSVLGNSGNLQVRVAPTDGGPSIATGPTMSDFYPWLWSPDSSKILMYLDDGSSTSAYLLDPEGGPYEQVPWESGSGIDWQRLAP